MSQINNNNNNNTTAPTFPNPYITRKLNNMDKARMMKAERDNWTRTYHKTLKGLEVMIDIQRQIKEILKIAAEMNTIITEVENSILTASINNQTINITNIAEVSEDLRYLIQSNIENWVFQIQRMLPDELNVYKGQGNKYVDKHIQEIQDLYKENEDKKEERVEDEEIILIKPYKIDKLTSTTKSSFIDDEVKNLIKYMKFIWSPTCCGNHLSQRTNDLTNE